MRKELLKNGAVGKRGLELPAVTPMRAVAAAWKGDGRLGFESGASRYRKSQGRGGSRGAELEGKAVPGT